MKGVLRSAHQIPPQPKIQSQISYDLVIVLKVRRVVIEQEPVVRHTARIERKCRSSQEKRLEAVKKYQPIEVLREIPVHAGMRVHPSEAQEVLAQRITDRIRPRVVVLRLAQVRRLIRTNSEPQHFEAVNVVGHVVARPHDAQLIGGRWVLIRYLAAEVYESKA